ncbi:FAD-binding domain-containing protein [Massarina eburnea CBS 473.64]|uniref:FAD-binding domain-containing protein n=1 Tax=Massarina eburnea CBS 473.64 TaxID=1395130 RepID=A0A6A6S008_9PLEO|nr:FAD-binding domain-containing protein [Massarina eburnea CBS 473.64]
MKLELLANGLLAGLASASFAKRTEQVADCLGNKNVPVKWENSPDYAELAETFNLRLTYKPKVIVLPTTSQHVQDAVKCANNCGYKVQARSGGHSYASYSAGGQDGSMVINLQGLHTITVDSTTNVAQVGGGVRLGNLAQGVFDQGKRAISHGTCPGVGIGGHFTHGGYGHTSRNWGLALDHIVALDVVKADGTLVKADSTTNSDLFWALRGAADSFGIITNFYLNTHPAPESVTYFSLSWGNKLYGSQEDFTNTFLHLQEVSLNKSVIDNRISYGIYLDGAAAYNLGGTFFGTPEEFNATVLPEILRSAIAPNAIVVQAYDWIGYLKLMSDVNSIEEPVEGYDQHDTFFAKSITVPESDGLTKEALDSFYDYIHQDAPISWFVIINLYGGPGSNINSKDTTFAAYNDRDSLWVFQNYGVTSDQTGIDFINGINDAIIDAQPETHFGAYLNYVDPTYSAETAHELYYGEELTTKLEALKGQYDPKSTFWNPQAFGQ